MFLELWRLNTFMVDKIIILKLKKKMRAEIKLLIIKEHLL